MIKFADKSTLSNKLETVSSIYLREAIMYFFTYPFIRFTSAADNSSFSSIPAFYFETDHNAVCISFEYKKKCQNYRKVKVKRKEKNSNELLSSIDHMTFQFGKYHNTVEIMIKL